MKKNVHFLLPFHLHSNLPHNYLNYIKIRCKIFNSNLFTNFIFYKVTCPKYPRERNTTIFIKGNNNGNNSLIQDRGLILYVLMKISESDKSSYNKNENICFLCTPIHYRLIFVIICYIAIINFLWKNVCIFSFTPASKFIREIHQYFR